MQTKDLYRATIRVANTTGMSGTATADEFNRGLRSGKERNLGCIIGLPVLRSLLASGIFVALALAPASAEAQGVPGEIAALKAQVTALQTQVDKLQTQLTAVQSNNALKLGPFVSVNPNGTGLDKGVTGPNIYFTGANIHIVSGSTTTVDTVTGLGNLIIGYNEPPPVIFPGSRSGSHNLIIGRFNSFFQAAFGGLVVGEANIISAEGASVSGGGSNTASGTGASVSGGTLNIASGSGASVSGGGNNTASGSVASVSGGFGNTASGSVASVTGGQFNSAGGIETVVIGGLQVTDNADRSIAPQPPFP
jgi:hypothetical protein